MEFPRGRRFGEFTMEVVGTEIVVFFEQTIRYHRFSHDAFQIWQVADGSVSELELAELVYGDRSELSLFRVERALDELERDGLLEEPTAPRGRRFDRRAVTRLVTAAALGGVALPVVTSITVPDSAAAQSRILQAGEECGPHISGVCVSGLCCCQRPEPLPPICADSASCGAAGAGFSCM